MLENVIYLPKDNEPTPIAKQTKSGQIVESAKELNEILLDCRMMAAQIIDTLKGADYIPKSNLSGDPNCLTDHMMIIRDLAGETANMLMLIREAIG